MFLKKNGSGRKEETKKWGGERRGKVGRKSSGEGREGGRLPRMLRARRWKAARGGLGLKPTATAMRPGQGTAKQQGPQQLGSTSHIPDARFTSLLHLLRLNFGFEALDLPAQVRNDVRILHDAVGHVQEIGFTWWVGPTAKVRASGNCPATRGIHATRTPAHFVRKTQIDTT